MDGIDTLAEETPYQRYRRLVSRLLIVGLLLGLEYYNPMREQIVEGIEAAIASLGLLAPLLFICVLALGVLLFFPPLVFIGIGAVAFGRMLGTTYSLIGITLGASCAFLLGRYAITDLAKALTQRFKRVNNWTGAHGFALIISLRLIFFGNPFLNYASGATPVALKDYCLGTLVGLIPRTLVLSYLFELIRDAQSVWDLANPSLLCLPAIRIGGTLFLLLLVKKERRAASAPELCLARASKTSSDPTSRIE